MTENMPLREEFLKVRRAERWRAVRSWLGSLAVALIVVAVLRLFVFTIISVSGSSMDDTLADGERLYVSLLTPQFTGYQRGDIVICRYPGADHNCVKRVIGLPGETVEVAGGVTYIDGEPMEEPYLDSVGGQNCAPIELGEGEYFVMGDNRPVSRDSRSKDVGAVTDMLGVVRFVIWPMDKMGSVQ